MKALMIALTIMQSMLRMSTREGPYIIEAQEHKTVC